MKGSSKNHQTDIKESSNRHQRNAKLSLKCHFTFFLPESDPVSAFDAENGFESSEHIENDLLAIVEDVEFVTDFLFLKDFLGVVDLLTGIFLLKRPLL